MLNYTFDKPLRLLNAEAYKSVFDDATFKVSSSQTLLLARINKHPNPRLGLVIAKKNIKLANQRNRIKRIIRESFRLKQHQLHNIDVVVLARRGLDQLDNTEIHSMFDRLWQQLHKKVDKQAKKDGRQ